MFITHCPICDCTIKLKDEDELYGISTCPSCGFDFHSNRCANPECRKHLNYRTMFCPMCGNESTFYLDCYDVKITFFDDGD